MQPTSEKEKERMAEALSAFLSTLPDGVPEDVLDALGGRIKTQDGILPPKLFFEIVEQLAIAISISDMNGKILYCNPTFEELTGYPEDEMIGKAHSVLSYKKTPLEVYQSLWNSITNKKKWNGTLLNKRKDDTPYLADLTVAPVLNQNEDIIYFLGIHRDVTDQMMLERKLNNQKSLLETVIDDAPMVLCVLDEVGAVRVENHGYKVLMADLDGEEPSDAILATVEEVTGFDRKTLFEDKRDFDNVELRIDFNGSMRTRWFSCSGTWIENAKIDPDSYFDTDVTPSLLIICNDISKQRYHFEQAKTNAIKALMAEKQMVQGMNEVLSGAVFQLQGPVNLISAALAMVERGSSDPLALRTMLKQVQQSGEEALEKLKSCMPKPVEEAKGSVSINEVVREVLDISVEKFLSEGVVVAWKPTPIVPQLAGQSNGLRSMIKHILDNAVSALNEPGAVGRDIHISSAVIEDDFIELIITDTGPGVTDDMRHKIFEPFYSGWKRTRGSSGMGLAIVQQVLTEHDGTIDLLPSMGGGLKVRVCLPITEGSNY